VISIPFYLSVGFPNHVLWIWLSIEKFPFGCIAAFDFISVQNRGVWGVEIID